MPGLWLSSLSKNKTALVTYRKCNHERRTPSTLQPTRNLLREPLRSLINSQLNKLINMWSLAACTWSLGYNRRESQVCKRINNLKLKVNAKYHITIIGTLSILLVLRGFFQIEEANLRTLKCIIEHLLEKSWIVRKKLLTQMDLPWLSLTTKYQEPLTWVQETPVFYIPQRKAS